MQQSTYKPLKTTCRLQQHRNRWLDQLLLGLILDKGQQRNSTNINSNSSSASNSNSGSNHMVLILAKRTGRDRRTGTKSQQCMNMPESMNSRSKCVERGAAAAGIAAAVGAGANAAEAGVQVTIAAAVMRHPALAQMLKVG